MDSWIHSSAFYKGKRVLVTGHTGFKGSWLCHMLKLAGAEVTGYSLQPPQSPNLFEVAAVALDMRSVFADIRDFETLQRVFTETHPEIVFHLAAQPLVREGYSQPRLTYETNVMGTINILECIRRTPEVRSAVIVTTDKVYENREWLWGYRENERLNGYDPYSNSKSCAELATWSYQRSFFKEQYKELAISTVRAGNVIGGGDFSPNRIIPDCVRAASRQEKILVRHPASIRPYQHVLEPLNAYLQLAQAQYQDQSLADSYNIGPEDSDCLTTAQLASLFCQAWGEGVQWYSNTLPEEGPHEAGCLRLDCSKIKQRLNWRPRWNSQKAIQETVSWYKAYLKNDDLTKIMTQQILEYSKEQAHV